MLQIETALSANLYRVSAAGEIVKWIHNAYIHVPLQPASPPACEEGSLADRDA